MKKQTTWHKKIGLVMAAAMLMAAMPVQASESSSTGKSANMISSEGETSIELNGDLHGGKSDAMFYFEGFPFTVTTSGKSSPAQTYEFVFSPNESGNPMPKVDQKDIDAGKVKVNENGSQHYFATTEAVGSGDSAKATVQIGMIEFDKEGTYTYTLRQEVGSSNYVTYDRSSYTIRFVAQMAENSKRTVSVAVSKGNATSDKSLPEFTNTYTRPVEPDNPPPTTPPTPVEETPTVLGALRSLPQVLGAARDAIMTGDTSALTIATIVFAGTCIALAAWLASYRKRQSDSDDNNK